MKLARADRRANDAIGENWCRRVGTGVLAGVLGLWVGVGAAGEPSKVSPVSVAEVEALELPLTLEQVMAAIDLQFQGVESALATRARKVEALVAFYGWQDGKEEVGLLGKSLANLEAIHALKARQQARAEIKDEEFLRSENQVLGERMTLLRKRSECRGHLLRLLDLANVEVVSGHESDKPKLAQDAERGRE
jgi:hypothetical protein